MMQSIAKVLRPGGTFIQISFQQPHFRKKYLESCPLLALTNVETVDVGLGYFFFVMQKKKQEDYRAAR